MKIKDSVVTIFLVFIIIVLIGIIGAFGYVIYNQIIGGGKIQINFGGEAGYPTIEMTTSQFSAASLGEEAHKAPLSIRLEAFSLVRL